jgi:hypothetical protein
VKEANSGGGEIGRKAPGGPEPDDVKLDEALLKTSTRRT